MTTSTTRLRSLTLLCIVSCISYTWCVGQSAIGAFGGLSLNRASASFEQLDGVLNCNSFFTSGKGFGPAAGLYYEHPVVGKLSFMVRGAYRQANTTLVSSEFTAIGVSGVAMDARIDHTLDAAIGIIGIQPSLKMSLFSGLSISAGIEAGYVLQHSFEQRETLEQPADVGAFATGTRTRNEQSGQIPNANKFIMSVSTVLSYALPLNADNTIQLMPELAYGLALTPVARDIDWSISSFSAGVGLRFVIPERTVIVPAEPIPPIDQPPIIASAPPIVESVPPLLLATLNAYGVDEKGVEAPVALLRVEEVASTRVLPLLPYVFFDHAETELPSRYRRSPQADNALAMHMGMLHELARRMQETPTAKLSITGMTLSNKNATISDGTAFARATSVATYLHEALGIDLARLPVASSPLPAATTPAIFDNDGVAEVNRVELSSDEAAILAPIKLHDTTRIATPPVLRFRTSLESTEPATRWQIVVSQNGTGLKTFKGLGSPPATVDWVLADEQESMPQVPGIIEMQLEIATATGVATARTDLRVDQLTMRRKKMIYIADREIEEFNIVLFDIGSAELTSAQLRVIESDIKPRIRSNSVVSIVGHTDRMGDALTNAALSLSRALNTARALGVPSANVRGLGEDLLIFDNTTPEARCLCRTVAIRIETPTEAR